VVATLPHLWVSNCRSIAKYAVGVLEERRDHTLVVWLLVGVGLLLAPSLVVAVSATR